MGERRLSVENRQRAERDGFFIDEAGAFGLPRSTASFVAVHVVVVCDIFGAALSSATMPFYVKETFGGTAQTVGFVLSTWAAGNIVSNAWMAWASDRWGRRPILIFSIICSTIGFIATGLAWDLPSLFAARAFLGLTSGSMAVGESYISDVSSAKERGGRMSRMGAMLALTFMVGPSLGSLVSTTPLGLHAPFFVGAVGSLFASGFAYHSILNKDEIARLKRSTPSARARARWARLQQHYCPSVLAQAGRSKDDTRWRTVLLVALNACFTTSLMLSSQVTLPIGPLATLGMDEKAMGLIMTTIGFMAALTGGGIFPKVSKAVGLYKSGAIGAFLVVTAELLWGMVGRGFHDFAMLAVGVPIFGIGVMMCNVCTSPVLANSASASNTGQIIALGAMGGSAGRAIGPAIFGTVLQTFGPAAVFYASAATSAAVCVIWLVAEHLDQREDAAREAQGLSKSRNLFTAVMEAVAANRALVKERVIKDLQEELAHLLHKRGYNLNSPTAFDDLSEVLHLAFMAKTAPPPPRQKGAASRSFEPLWETNREFRHSEIGRSSPWPGEAKPPRPDESPSPPSRVMRDKTRVRILSIAKAGPKKGWFRQGVAGQMV